MIFDFGKAILIAVGILIALSAVSTAISNITKKTAKDSECNKETAGCQNCRFAIKVH